jgi:hypothetical protein
VTAPPVDVLAVKVGDGFAIQVQVVPPVGVEVHHSLTETVV